jgi:hypothetical protein
MVALIEVENPPRQWPSYDGVPATTQPLVSRSWYESGGETFVAVMQARDFRGGDDLSDPGRLDRTRVRAILAERKMRARCA